MKVRFGSRGSALARWQTDHARELLSQAHPGMETEFELVQTTGDRITDVPLSMIGDKGLFTKEIDRKILDGSVDAAVHSLKDVPTRLEEGLAIAAVLERADPRDGLIPAPGRGPGLGGLPDGATVGTSSLRRRSQLLNLRPDLRIEDVRGNLDTRLARVRAGDYDAIILAMAGLLRLGWEAAVGETLDPPGWLPAAGQGAIAIVTRADDAESLAAIGALDHMPTRAAVTAERAFLGALEGGCQIPIGALATIVDGRLRIAGFVGSVDGRDVLRGETDGDAAGAAELGRRLAAELVDAGAERILRSVRGEPADEVPPPAAP